MKNVIKIVMGSILVLGSFVRADVLDWLDPRNWWKEQEITQEFFEKEVLDKTAQKVKKFLNLKHPQTLPPHVRTLHAKIQENPKEWTISAVAQPHIQKKIMITVEKMLEDPTYTHEYDGKRYLKTSRENFTNAVIVEASKDDFNQFPFIVPAALLMNELALFEQKYNIKTNYLVEQMVEKYKDNCLQLFNEYLPKQPEKPVTVTSPAEQEFTPMQQLQQAFTAGADWAKQQLQKARGSAARFSEQFARPSERTERTFERMEGLTPMRRQDYGIMRGLRSWAQPRMQQRRERAAQSPLFVPERRSPEALGEFERLQKAGIGY